MSALQESAPRRSLSTTAAPPPVRRMAWYNNLQAGDIVLPWASIAGFANVLAAMAVVIGLAGRAAARPHPSLQGG